MLKGAKLQLSSPFGYSPDFAADFSSTTSSCAKKGYGYATPTAGGINGTATATATSVTAAPTCASQYVVAAGDDCNSVARARGVSSFSIIYANSLNTDCDDFPEAGATLCLQDKCTTQTIGLDDDCVSVASKYAITRSQLQAWNPNLNSLCNNLSYGQVLCVG